MEDCIFCKIIEGKIPSEKIYEDENTLAFLDANPISPGHTLVIPKKHARNIFDITEDEFISVMKTVRKITQVIKKATKADGISIAQSNEKAGDQEVFHLHVHIIPRHDNDNRATEWTHKKYEEGEMQEVAKQIKQNL